MMTLEKWAASALRTLKDLIRALPDSAERENVKDLFENLERDLNELVELEQQEEG